MKKYIGIRGHRGSGKISIAYLIANTLEYLFDFNDIGEDFNSLYTSWCNLLMENEQEAVNNIDTPHVYLESFGDLPKMLTEMLTSIPHEYIYSDYYKDYTFISVRTMETKVFHDKEQLDEFLNSQHIWSSDELINYVDKRGFDESGYEYWMSLREFILYYAKTTSKYLGKDIWVKLMKMNELRDDEMQQKYNIFGSGDKYKLFVDLKASSEITYVKDRDGFIIKINRPNNVKSKGFDNLQNDDRFDYELNIEGGLYDLKNKIIEIAKIIKNR